MLSKTILAIWRENMLFVHEHYQENFKLRGTGNVRGQISEHTFPPNHWSCACYPSNTFRNARRFQNLGIWGHSHVTRLDRLCANETII